jgi:hypothetical protein
MAASSKLLGYSTGGGEFETTLSSKGAQDARAEYDKMLGYVKSLPTTPEADKDYVPPISMMAIVGYTHTQAPLSGADPNSANNNVVLSPFSAFYGGAITENIGAFAQVTYNAVPPGGFGDPFGHTWTWDNTDIRYASTARIGPLDLIYGITANNNPTVQDVWNTTPAWSFPYAASTILGPQGHFTAIEGAFAAHVGGVGAYTFINDLLYLELTGYKTLGFSQQNALGPIRSVSPVSSAALRPIGALRWNLTGAETLGCSAHSERNSTSIPGSIQASRPGRALCFLNPTNSPISASTPNISIKVIITG